MPQGMGGLGIITRRENACFHSLIAMWGRVSTHHSPIMHHDDLEMLCNGESVTLVCVIQLNASSIGYQNLHFHLQATAKQTRPGTTPGGHFGSGGIIRYLY